MKDFQGKVIKVYLNANSGWLMVSGPFIRKEDEFLIVKNNANGQIEYLNMAFVKYVEIVKEVGYKGEDLND